LKFEIHNISNGFPYLVTTGLAAPPQHRTEPTSQRQSPNTLGIPRLLAKARQRHQNRYNQQQMLKEKGKEDDLVLQQVINDVKVDSGSTIHLNQESDGLKPTGPSNRIIAVNTGGESKTTITRCYYHYTSYELMPARLTYCLTSNQIHC
jgi:hypothetical protein